MHIRNTLTTLIGGLLLALATAGAHAQAHEEGLLLQASQVLEELRATPERSIPNHLLERAYGVAVFPGLLKGAFFVGGRHGDGVFIMRDKDGRFTNPFFVSLTGASFGFQWGVQKEDIVLVFTTRKGVEGVTGGKVTLGADASVAAGPMGRDASASTDAGFKAEVYSYSHAKGLFLGVSIDGSVISVDSGSDAAFYKKRGVLASEIASGEVTADYEASRRFLKAVSISTGSGGDASAPVAGTQPPAAPAGPAQAYPLTPERPAAEAPASPRSDSPPQR
jgi:lipid-binding SYLF domain-containing protein